MQTAILPPVFALVALTFIVSVWMAALRIGAVKRGEVSMRYFKLNTGESPERPMQAANNFRNLFELPVLFYLLAVLLLVTEQADAVNVGLAWLFVASRYVHSLIHVTYNGVPHRLLAFTVGQLTLVAMWVRFGMQIAAG